MRTRHLTTAVVALFVALAATAVAQDDVRRTVPSAPHVPKKAKAMDVILAMSAANLAGWKEKADTAKWPEPTSIIVHNCKVTSRWRGRCDYYLTHFEPVPYQLPGYTRCTRRVVTRIAKKTHRVSSHKRSLGCKKA